MKIEQLRRLHDNLTKINAYSIKRMDDFYERTAKLKEEEQNLLIELIGQFINCNLNQTPSYYLSAYQTIDTNVLQGARNIIFAPLESLSLEKSGEKKTNSGIFFCRLLRSIQNQFPYKEKFFFCETCKMLFDNYREGDLVLLVDDFIGTGRTVQETLDNMLSYSEKKGISMVSYSSLHILTMVGMKRGVRFCNNTLRIPCHVANIQDKMISKNPTFDKSERLHKLQLMLNIERTLFPSMNSENSLGFMQSEALVNIMEKCPNNTFPFYWYGRKPSPIFIRNYQR